MAETNTQEVAGTVPFFADADDSCRIDGSDKRPVMLINPDASILDLWQVAEARLLHLQKVLGVLVSTGPSGVVFEPSDYAEIFKPRVDEILILAAEANMRAKSEMAYQPRSVNANQAS